MAKDSPDLPWGVDHLVYTVPDLAQGMDEVEGILGVRPALGGRHPDFGTHNALLSFGPATYLEIIAPDPELARPSHGLPFGMDGLKEPRLAAWALRTESIEETAASAGADLGAVLSGGREKPDGTVLSWKLTDPNKIPLGGTVPFLISWGETPHPAKSVPWAGELVGLRVEHLHPDRVREVIASLGVKVGVSRSDLIRLVARIRTVDGEVALG